MAKIQRIQKYVNTEKIFMSNYIIIIRKKIQYPLRKNGNLNYSFVFLQCLIGSQ